MPSSTQRGLVPVTVSCCPFNGGVQAIAKHARLGSSSTSVLIVSATLFAPDIRRTAHERKTIDDLRALAQPRNGRRPTVFIGGSGVAQLCALIDDGFAPSSIAGTVDMWIGSSMPPLLDRVYAIALHVDEASSTPAALTALLLYTLGSAGSGYRFPIMHTGDPAQDFIWPHMLSHRAPNAFTAISAADRLDQRIRTAYRLGGGLGQVRYDAASSCAHRSVTLSLLQRHGCRSFARRAKMLANGAVHFLVALSVGRSVLFWATETVRRPDPCL